MEELEKIFFEEYEREKARHAFRSDREKRAARGQKIYSYSKDLAVGVSLLYSMYILREWGFEVEFFLWKDRNFLISLAALILPALLGFILFPK